VVDIKVDPNGEYTEIYIDGLLPGYIEPLGDRHKGSFSGASAGNWEFTTINSKYHGMCCRENRLWAYDNDKKEIYASKLGSVSEWHSFKGIASDSYTATVPSPGDFTACASWMGYTLFFKEDRIVRVSGTKPANYTITEIMTDGVASGSNQSVVEINGILYYHSPNGIMAYDGNFPTKISTAIAEKWKNVKACTADGKYYCNVEQEGKYYLYCYDTTTGLWHKEDSVMARQMFNYKGEAYMLSTKGSESAGTLVRKLHKLSPGNISTDDFGFTTEQTAEPDFDFSFETEEMHFGSINRKKCVDLKLRYSNSGEAVVYVCYDGGEWQEVSRIDVSEDGVKVIPLSDIYFDNMRVKIAGTGDFELKALSYSVREGTDV
jgi:hypothetical protein